MEAEGSEVEGSEVEDAVQGEAAATASPVKEACREEAATVDSERQVLAAKPGEAAMEEEDLEAVVAAKAVV